MDTSLQEAFLRSRGEAVRIGESLVRQMVEIPLKRGEITVEFLSELNGRHGISISSKNGWIRLSDGSTTPRLHIWNEPGLPSSVTHEFESRDGVIRIWNVYRIRHPSGIVTEDYFTGNAGIVVLEQGPSHVRLGCSGGLGDFDPQELVVEISWTEDGPRVSGER